MEKANNHIEETVVGWLEGWEKVRSLVSEELFDTILQYKEENGVWYGWIYTTPPYGKWIKISQ